MQRGFVHGNWGSLLVAVGNMGPRASPVRGTRQTVYSENICLSSSSIPIGHRFRGLSGVYDEILSRKQPTSYASSAIRLSSTAVRLDGDGCRFQAGHTAVRICTFTGRISVRHRFFFTLIRRP